MDTVIAGLPSLFWFKGQWYRINSAGITNSAAHVELEPPNTELEAALKHNLISGGNFGETYTLDMGNKRNCFKADLRDYNEWLAKQGKEGN